MNFQVSNTASRWSRALALAWLAPAALPLALSAQSPPPATVNLPGWVPADRVSPRLNVSATQDPKTLLWNYRYTLVNGAAASQAIVQFTILTRAAIVRLSAPQGWSAVRSASTDNVGVTFVADLVDDLATPAALSPGSAALMFEIVSPSAPGLIDYYVRGNAPEISLEELTADQQSRIPSPQADAIRGTAKGPQR